jgi:hypothetical protein
MEILRPTQQNVVITLEAVGFEVGEVAPLGAGILGQPGGGARVNWIS